MIKFTYYNKPNLTHNLLMNAMRLIRFVFVKIRKIQIDVKKKDEVKTNIAFCLAPLQ